MNMFHSLRKSYSFTVQFDGAALRNSHVAAGLLVLYARRNDDLQVGDLALDWG